MRTLKKSLSLVLVLAMVFSFCAFSTSAADYADADKINPEFTEAIQVLSSLEILMGDASGFRPNDTLTRAEACVIITKMLGDEDTAKGAKCTFDDVVGHWAAPFIGYCADQSIVSGVGDNKFAPDALLSGYDFTLMIIRALGYDPVIEEIGGNDYTIDTAKFAKQIGLIETVELTGATTFTREMAAQLAFDGLTKITAVHYENTGNVVAGNGNVTSINKHVVPNTDKDGNELSLYADVFGGKISYILVTDNDASDPLAEGSTTGLVVTHPTSSTAEISNSEYMTFNVATGIDEIGHVLKVFYVKADTPTKKGVAYTAVDLSTETTVYKPLTDVSRNEAEKALGFKLADSITPDVAFVNYDVDTAAEVVIKDGSDWDVTPGDYVTYRDQVIYMTAPATIEKYNVVPKNINKGYYEVKTGGTDVYVVAERADDCKDIITVAGGIDWLKVPQQGILLQTVTCGDKLFASPVRTVEGKVTMVNDTGVPYVYDGVVFVDGVRYEFNDEDEPSKLSALLGSSADIDDLKTDFVNTYTFYLNGRNQIFAFVQKTDEAATWNPVYIVETAEVEDNNGAFEGFAYYAQYYAADGTINTKKIVKLDDKLVVKAAAKPNQVTYDSNDFSGWMLVAETTGGVMFKTLADDAYTNGYMIADLTGAALTEGTTKLDGKFVNSKSNFLYSDFDNSLVDGLFAYAENAVCISGSHKNDDLSGTVEAVLVRSANMGGQDIYAAFVATEAPAIDNENVYVLALDGKVADVVPGEDAFSYTVLDEQGNIKHIVADAGSYFGDGSKVVKKNANGTITLGSYDSSDKEWQQGDYSTATAYTSTFYKDGVRYFTIDGHDYFVNNVKVVDNRLAVIKGEISAIETFDGMLDEAVGFTPIYSVHPVTNARTLLFIIINN